MLQMTLGEREMKSASSACVFQASGCLGSEDLVDFGQLVSRTRVGYSKNCPGISTIKVNRWNVSHHRANDQGAGMCV